MPQLELKIFVSPEPRSRGEILRLIEKFRQRQMERAEERIGQGDVILEEETIERKSNEENQCRRSKTFAGNSTFLFVKKVDPPMNEVGERHSFADKMELC